jgi:hypothetical protein
LRFDLAESVILRLLPSRLKSYLARYLTTMAAVRRRDRRQRQNNIVMLRRPRLFQRVDPFNGLNDNDIFERYRFRRATINSIVTLIEPRLTHPTKRNSPLPAIMQVLCALRFVATGAFHSLVADSVKVHRTSCGVAIRRVLAALATLARTFIKFPVGQALRSTQQAFYKLAGISLL